MSQPPCLCPSLPDTRLCLSDPGIREQKEGKGLGEEQSPGAGGGGYLVAPHYPLPGRGWTLEDFCQKPYGGARWSEFWLLFFLFFFFK